MGRGRKPNPALARAFLRAETEGNTDIEAAWRWAKKPGTLSNAQRTAGLCQVSRRASRSQHGAQLRSALAFGIGTQGGGRQAGGRQAGGQAGSQAGGSPLRCHCRRLSARAPQGAASEPLGG